jgi:hypothetical protein
MTSLLRYKPKCRDPVRQVALSLSTEARKKTAGNDESLLLIELLASSPNKP